MRRELTRWQTCGLTLEAVDLLFADRDGKRPSIFKVVRDSKKKEYLAKIEETLQERARGREDVGVEVVDEKFDVAHLENEGSRTHV